jgi:hypothetical protein
MAAALKMTYRQKKKEEGNVDEHECGVSILGFRNPYVSAAAREAEPAELVPLEEREDDDVDLSAVHINGSGRAKETTIRGRTVEVVSDASEVTRVRVATLRRPLELEMDGRRQSGQRKRVVRRTLMKLGRPSTKSKQDGQMRRDDNAQVIR